VLQFTDTKPSGFNQHDWQVVGIGYSIEMYVYVPKGKRWDLNRALIYTCSLNISEERDLWIFIARSLITNRSLFPSRRNSVVHHQPASCAEEMMVGFCQIRSCLMFSLSFLLVTWWSGFLLSPYIVKRLCKPFLSCFEKNFSSFASKKTLTLLMKLAVLLSSYLASKKIKRFPNRSLQHWR
jgi:hypothetical protein